MFWALKGVVHSKTCESIIVEVKGVFYEVLVAPKHVEEFDTEEEILIYTRESVKENSPIDLIGFVDEAERALYDSLVKVNGIGPKNALRIIDVTDFDTFARAVNSKDMSFLRSLPGVGTKTAERMILELSGKLDVSGKVTGQLGEAVETMIALGFSHFKAFEAVKRASESGAKDLEQLVKKALSFVNKS